jgi:energy-coupling factor transporter transmembrane protein EcfT
MAPSWPARRRTSALPSDGAGSLLGAVGWLRALTVAALVGIGGVHLNLYAGEGYRHIPTIGPLFLLTVVVAFLLAVAVALLRHWLVALVAAGFSFATLGGYVLSLLLPKGIFLFQEPGVSYSGALAIAFEVIAGVAALAIAWATLATSAGAGAPGPNGARRIPATRRRRRPRRPAPPGRSM